MGIRQAGGNGNGIRLSPDGERIVYLSHVGTPMHSKNLLGISARDFDQPAVTYETRDVGTTRELTFHPALPWVAVPGGSSAVLFDRETGRVLERKLQLTSKGLNGAKVERLMFSPNGVASLSK